MWGDLKFFVDYDFSMATGLRNRRAGEGGEEREREGMGGRVLRREQAALVYCHGNPLPSAANCQSQSGS